MSDFLKKAKEKIIEAEHKVAGETANLADKTKEKTTEVKDTVTEQTAEHTVAGDQ